MCGCAGRSGRGRGLVAAAAAAEEAVVVGLRVCGGGPARSGGQAAAWDVAVRPEEGAGRRAQAEPAGAPREGRRKGEPAAAALLPRSGAGGVLAPPLRRDGRAVRAGGGARRPREAARGPLCSAGVGVTCGKKRARRASLSRDASGNLIYFNRFLTYFLTTAH